MVAKNIPRLTIINLLSIFLISWVINGCGFSFQDKYGNQTSPFEKEVILEVKTNSSKSVYPSGKTLDIKLYNNKGVEFDFYPPNAPDIVGIPFSYKREKTQLDEEDFRKITELLGKSDLISANNSYQPTNDRSVDATVKKIITFKVGTQEKTIVLDENDSHLHLKENSNVYPTSLIQLLNVITSINKKLRGQIDPNSR